MNDFFLMGFGLGVIVMSIIGLLAGSIKEGKRIKKELMDCLGCDFMKERHPEYTYCPSCGRLLEEEIKS